jgi:hypothetical protein
MLLKETVVAEPRSLPLDWNISLWNASRRILRRYLKDIRRRRLRCVVDTVKSTHRCDVVSGEIMMLVGRWSRKCGIRRFCCTPNRISTAAITTCKCHPQPYRKNQLEGEYYITVYLAVNCELPKHCHVKFESRTPYKNTPTNEANIYKTHIPLENVMDIKNPLSEGNTQPPTREQPPKMITGLLESVSG